MIDDVGGSNAGSHGNRIPQATRTQYELALMILQHSPLRYQRAGEKNAGWGRFPRWVT